MNWFNVHVEDKVTGIVGVHTDLCNNPSEARDREEARGYYVTEVTTFGQNNRWPNLPNYRGRV